MRFVFGTGGFAREVEWLLYEAIGTAHGSNGATVFVTDNSSNLVGTTLRGGAVISESTFLAEHALPGAECYLATGSPLVRRKIAGLLSGIRGLVFPPIVHPSVMMDRRPGAIDIGDGTLLCAGSVLTTDIQLGRFVHVNLDCTLGHDAAIGDFCTLSPGVHVSGNVRLGHGVFVGTGAVILERLSVCSGALIGAGAVVNRSIAEPGTYVGVPAKLAQR